MSVIDLKYIYKKSPEDIVIEMDLHSAIMPENPGHPMTLILRESETTPFEGGLLYQCFLHNRYYYEEDDEFNLEGKEYEEGYYYTGDLFVTTSEVVASQFIDGKDEDRIYRIETYEKIEGDFILTFDDSALWSLFPYEVMTWQHENAVSAFGACEGWWVYREEIVEMVASYFSK
jgi:hypothetical protein